LFRSVSRRHLIVSDNIYIRHKLATAVLAMGGRLKERAVFDSVSRIKSIQRGSWKLVAAVDSQEDSKKARNAHTRAQKKLPLSLRTQYAPPD
ncbi:hypothetical protein L914_03573, partial [Phytophthora nicotianae]